MAYSLITLEDSKSPISEAYRMLRTNIQFRNVDSDYKKIMITSAGRREGKSFTVANLAVSMAQDGKSVLVVDADLRNPTQNKLFGLDNAQGLSVALTLDQGLSQYIKETPVPGVKVLTAGPVPFNPAELIGSARMKRLIKEAGEQFDLVLFDTPPIIAVTDGALLAQEVDGVVLVLNLGDENQNYAQYAKEQLEKVNARFLGAVLNNVDMKPSEYCYYEYKEANQSQKKRKRFKGLKGLFQNKRVRGNYAAEL